MQPSSSGQDKRRQAGCRARRRQDVGQRLGQGSERDLFGHQDVQALVIQESHGGGKAPAGRPAGAPRRRDVPDLGRDELQPLAVEGAAQGRIDRAGPVPAHLDDPRLEAGARERRAEPLGRGGGVKHDIGLAGRILGLCKRCAQVFGERAAAGIEVDQRDLRSRNAGSEMGDQQPTTPPPTTTIRSPGPQPPSQIAFRAVSRLAARTARLGGTPSGTGTVRPAGTAKRSWWGCSAKTLRPRSSDGPCSTMPTAQ